MKDIVEKYHHYMTEAARLQALVNEQAEYIDALEEVLNEARRGLGATPGRNSVLLRSYFKSREVLTDPSASPEDKDRARGLFQQARVVQDRLDNPYGRGSQVALGHTGTRAEAERIARAGQAARKKPVMATEGNEEAAQAELTAADRDMKDVMAGVKAKNRPFLPKEKPVDLTPEALRLKAREDLEK